MKRRLIASVFAVMCLMTMTISAFAVEARASEQISQYSMDATNSSGTIKVYFSVSSLKTKTKIGCSSIYVYEKSGTRWSLVESLTEDDFGMSRTNTFSHKNTIYCASEAGVDYKVVVTIFAEDSTDRDTRTKTFYV